MAARTRHQSRHDRMRQRVADARTPDARLAAAFDWFRSSAEYLAKRGTRAEGCRGPEYGEAAQIVTEVTEYLTGMAERMERGRYDHAG